MGGGKGRETGHITTGAKLVSAQEILAQIQKLPPEERQLLLKALALEILLLSESLHLNPEEEVERILVAEGIVSEIPARLPDDEEETYEPIEVPGNSLSQTIIEERR